MYVEAGGSQGTFPAIPPKGFLAFCPLPEGLPKETAHMQVPHQSRPLVLRPDGKIQCSCRTLAPTNPETQVADRSS